LALDSIAAVMDVAAQLTEDNETQVQVGGDTFLVDLTLGIAVHPTHADDAKSLFRRAELALEEARKNELAFDIYSPDTTQQHAALWKLESDLDRAIHSRALEVYFQPKLVLSEARIRGVEALARWRSSSGVFVSPQQFVPLAERSGSIVPLTWLVFDRVSDSMPLWRQMGGPFTIAVNIAPQVLKHGDFFPRLARLTQSMTAAGIGLTLELTEDSLVQSEDMAPVLHRLRKLGIGIAIDDFGKGYSSLSYLKEIPATEVKIDKRFVAAVAVNEKDRQIVKVVNELARAFDMQVVAEGVDSEENLQAVVELGCDCAQGFYIARPMRGELINDWMHSFVRRTKRRTSGSRESAWGNS
jgi:EAL domain-containing protein (putative c-di-GMP-specific phosphodiesterase class I)